MSLRFSALTILQKLKTTLQVENNSGLGLSLLSPPLLPHNHTEQRRRLTVCVDGRMDPSPSCCFLCQDLVHSSSTRRPRLTKVTRLVQSRWQVQGFWLLVQPCVTSPCCSLQLSVPRPAPLAIPMHLCEMLILGPTQIYWVRSSEGGVQEPRFP